MLIGKAIFNICLLLISSCRLLEVTGVAMAKERKPTIFKLLTNIARIKFNVLKKLFQITAADHGGLKQAVLCMRIGAKHLAAAIADRHSKVIYDLIYYTGSNIDATQLDEVLTGHPEFKRDLDTIHVAYDFRAHLLMPVTDSEQENGSQLLKTLYTPDELPVFLKDVLPGRQLVNNYWVPAFLHDWIKNNYPGAQCQHQHTVDYKTANRLKSDGFYIDFRNDEFQLTASRDGTPVLLQVYEYSTPGDVLYYLLRACDQLGYTQQEVPVFVSGLIERQSGLFQALFQYFVHISFRLPEWEFPPAQHPAHFFTSLNDLNLCGS